jgi:hypothetical protein
MEASLTPGFIAAFAGAVTSCPTAHVPAVWVMINPSLLLELSA